MSQEQGHHGVRKWSIYYEKDDKDRTREDGSGTRGAFTELCGIVEDDKDNTVSSAEVTNSTAVMLTTVAGNAASIGYVSVGSLNDSVKALEVDGVAPSVDTISSTIS